MTGQCHACDCRQTVNLDYKKHQGQHIHRSSSGCRLVSRPPVCCLRELTPLERCDKSGKAKLLILLHSQALKPAFRARCHFFCSTATGPPLLTQGHTQLVYTRLKLYTQAQRFVKTISSQRQSAGKEILTTTQPESHYMHIANSCNKRCCHFECCSHSLRHPEVPACWC